MIENRPHGSYRRVIKTAIETYSKNREVAELRERFEDALLEVDTALIDHGLSLEANQKALQSFAGAVAALERRFDRVESLVEQMQIDRQARSEAV